MNWRTIENGPEVLDLGNHLRLVVGYDTGDAAYFYDLSFSLLLYTSGYVFDHCVSLSSCGGFETIEDARKDGINTAHCVLTSALNKLG